MKRLFISSELDESSTENLTLIELELLSSQLAVDIFLGKLGDYHEHNLSRLIEVCILRAWLEWSPLSAALRILPSELRAKLSSRRLTDMVKYFRQQLNHQQLTTRYCYQRIIQLCHQDPLFGVYHTTVDIKKCSWLNSAIYSCYLYVNQNWVKFTTGKMSKDIIVIIQYQSIDYLRLIKSREVLIEFTDGDVGKKLLFSSEYALDILTLIRDYVKVLDVSQ